MGALRLEISQYLVMEGSFRVVVGDTYNSSLSDHSSDLFHRKSQVYKTLIESIFRRSDLTYAFKQCSILGFANGSLVVFFRLILDRRKIPKRPVSLEDHISDILIREVSNASPVKKIKIDQTQVFIKRQEDDELHTSTQAEEQKKNQTIEIHNGLLRKGPPRTLLSHYANRTEKIQPPKTIVSSNATLQGAFTLTDAPKTNPTVSDRPQTPASSHEHQRNQQNSYRKPSLVENIPTVNFYQHSPALNSFLYQKQRVESIPTTTTSTPVTMEPALTDLITLLPYVFQSEEEPWRPMLPENFTRYPERAPIATGDYYSEGVGVVEVVLDPGDLTSSIPLKHVIPYAASTLNRPGYPTNDSPVNINLMPSFNRPKYTKELFQPRSDDQVLYFLNTFAENHFPEEEHYDTVHGGIVTKQKSFKEIKENSSAVTALLPDLQLLQRFHDMDTFLRSHEMETGQLDQLTETPVTLLPARSNVNVRNQIRPRPKQSGYTNTDSTNVSQKHIVADFITDSKKTNPNALNLLDNKATDSYNIQTEMTETNVEGQTQIPFNLPRKSDAGILTPRQLVTEDLLSNKFDSINNDEGIKREPFSVSDEIEVITISSTSTGSKSFKIILQNEENNNSSDLSLSQIEFNMTNLALVNYHDSGSKLKDTKMQDMLEKIMVENISTEKSIISQFTSKDPTTYNLSSEANIAHNRKYVQTGDNMNNIGNSSHYEGKSDFILYSLKQSTNQTGTFPNTYANSGNGEKNKTVSNYVLNKDGFLMLTKVYNKANVLETSNQDSVKSKADENQASDCSDKMHLKCGSGECINSLSRCNTLVDCSDGSDEQNCTCAEYLKAQYLTRKLCDGVVDCWDFSDENTCEWCHSGQYVCSNSRMCVDRERVCDGQFDCPNGDDENNCVSIAQTIPQADSRQYYSSGILMIQKEGQWGKLCTQNFESLSSYLNAKWSLNDLGAIVCRKMTFRTVSSIEHSNDTSDERPGTYYELLRSQEESEHLNKRLGLTFGNTNCTEKKVLRITCSNLECGMRPQVNPQWSRDKRVAGVRRSRIVGGGNAGPGSWPWLAALYKEGVFQCGATLISDRWLLSAGHCFYHAIDEFWVARLGALRRGTNLPSPYEQLRVVSRILLHPNYVDSGFINDISLLQMEEPISFTNYVRPICLPTPTAALKDGKMCTVIGWGQLFEIGRIFPDTLQEVQLPVISTVECRKRTLFLPLYRVTENMFCAGYDRGGRDACLGDSGGPLMCQETNGHWSLIGVTSNGYGCARANRPGVYTKVANYVDWVHSSMANDNVDSIKRNVTCHGHRCPLGECLPPARICNGFMECSDGSDEKDCYNLDVKNS